MSNLVCSREKLESIAFLNTKKLYIRYQTHLKDNIQEEQEGFIPDEKIKTLGMHFDDFKYKKKLHSKLIKKLSSSIPYKIVRISYKEFPKIFKLVTVRKMISAKNIRFTLDNYIWKCRYDKILKYLESLGIDIYFLNTKFTDLEVTPFELFKFMIELIQVPRTNINVYQKEFYHEVLKPIMIKCFNGDLLFTFNRIDAKLSYV